MDSDTLISSDILETILVVDDEPAIRHMLATFLKRQPDRRVLESSDGFEAKTILAEEDVDLVVTDLLMPGMDGLELMRWVKEHRPGPDWIVLTGHGTFDDAVRAIQLGAFDFLSKPLPTLDMLEVAVRNALHRRRMERERAALQHTIERSNEQLRHQVNQLERACTLLMLQAETIDSDLHRAERIQRALLPRQAPPLEDMSIRAVYRPSRNVGGDLYDIVRLDDRHAVLYIADAAGHGVSAAMLAVLFKHRLPLTWGHPPTPTPPAQVLEEVNRAVVEECTGSGLFVTAAYCLIDMPDRVVNVASAGHPPLAVIRRDARVEHIHHTGPALGIDRNARFAQVSMRLDPGDTLLLYTDGLTDGVAGEASAERLIDICRERVGIDALREMVESRDSEEEKAARDDDMTAILLATGRGESVLDNGRPSDIGTVEMPTLSETPHVLTGRNPAGRFVAVIGRGGWTHCSSLYECCLKGLEDRAPLTLDLGRCEYLDSTFIGTVQELLDRFQSAGVRVRLQGVVPQVRSLFEELGMARVLAALEDEALPLPETMHPVAASDTTDADTRRRMLQAHQTLASLSESNRGQFARLIEHMHRELHPADT